MALNLVSQLIAIIRTSVMFIGIKDFGLLSQYQSATTVDLSSPTDFTRVMVDCLDVFDLMNSAGRSSSTRNSSKIYQRFIYDMHIAYWPICHLVIRYGLNFAWLCSESGPTYYSMKLMLRMALWSINGEGRSQHELCDDFHL